LPTGSTLKVDRLLEALLLGGLARSSRLLDTSGLVRLAAATYCQHLLDAGRLSRSANSANT
jgi:hypothetical protein